MKQLKSILLFTSLLSIMPLYADMNDEASLWANYDTYGGVNYKHQWIKPESQWRTLFPSTRPGFNVYLGWRFHRYLAAELGYEWTANKPTSVQVPNGTSFLGVNNTTGTPITLTGKSRFKTGYFDLNALFPFLGSERAPELIVSFGVSGMKAAVKIAAAPLTPTTFSFTSQFTPLEGRSKAVFRFGLGLQSLLIENVGARVIWRYENTSVLRVRNTLVAEAASTRALFKDSQSIAVGLFVKF